ncbi:MAG TPA: WYL domain-containing protein [Actinomycetota bacterium]
MAERDAAAATNAAGRTAAKAEVRLRRLLVLVPYIVRHPGARVAEVSSLFGIGEGDLLQDLQLLFMAGLPPYGPGDLIDVEIEEGRVWITMADYFSRPARLTASEALSLYLRGKVLLGTPGLDEAPALASALAKIERGLEGTLESLAEHVEVDAPGRAETRLGILRRAVEGRRVLRIEYYTAARDELTEREIDPEQLFSAIGHWYVVAWDHRSDDERMFRTDRIRSIQETGATFQPRGLAGADRPLYTRSDDDVPVRLLLGPGARWVAEYYETERVAEREDGRLDVTLPAKDLPWVAKLVLRLGGEAEVADPPELAEMVVQQAARALALYGA